jgi:hypothetical protein
MRLEYGLIGFGLGVGVSALIAAMLLPQIAPAFGEQHGDTGDPITRYTFWLMLFTGVLAAATIGLFIYANIQASDAKQSIAATRLVAEAANKSAKLNETNMLSTQRAFVFINQFETHVIRDYLIILPKWENSGTTPTKKMTNWVSWKIFTGAPPSDYDFPDLDNAGNPLPSRREGLIFSIGPKATKFSETLKIPINLVEQVGDGKARLFVWGRAEYNDVFENTPPHHTEFCNEVIITNISREDNKVEASVQFALYGSHNLAD